MECKLRIDNREQNPLTFRNTENYEVENGTLSYGDYGLIINGKLVFTFERKNPLDLFSSLAQGHNRLIAEFERAKVDNVPLVVVVECSYSDIINKKFSGSYNTKLAGYILIKILHTTQLRYNVPFLFFNNREEMRNYIRNTFSTIVKEEENILKQDKKQAKLNEFEI